MRILGVQGRRNFVVAANGYTKVFSKSGKQVKSFPSNLPGGNRNQVSSTTTQRISSIVPDSH